MTFQWDPAKARTNGTRHRVVFSDAVGVFEDPFAITIDDPHPREERFVTIGLDFLGRVLVVSWTPRDSDIRLISASLRALANADSTRPVGDNMRKQYDFSGGRRGPVVPVKPGKTRITIRLDDDVLEFFRERVEAAGGGSYQALINEALRSQMRVEQEPLEVLVRRVVKEELRKGKPTRRSKPHEAA